MPPWPVLPSFLSDSLSSLFPSFSLRAAGELVAQGGRCLRLPCDVCTLPTGPSGMQGNASLSFSLPDFCQATVCFPVLFRMVLERHSHHQEYEYKRGVDPTSCLWSCNGNPQPTPGKARLARQAAGLPRNQTNAIPRAVMETCPLDRMGLGVGSPIDLELAFGL